MNFYSFSMGIGFGGLLALFLCNIDNGVYVSKDKLRNKQLIYMKPCFVQYSTVRRFP